MRLLILLLTFGYSTVQLNAQLNTAQTKVDQLLIEKFAEAPIQEALILFKAMADLSGSRNFSNKAEKGTFVYETLQKVADQSQEKVISFLRTEGIAFRSFSIVNAIHAEVSMEQVATLATFTEVKNINANPITSFPEPRVEVAEASPRGAVEWGIAMIGATEVWALGITGEGAVVGGQDTGYDWTHPALQQKYRGWNNGTVDHNYNWHDAIHTISPLHGDSIPDPSNNPCGLDIIAPCDDHSHGTHTMGTMIGSEGENEIGVAPGAQWVGVRNMERGYGSPATYLEGYQWFLAPTDLNNENPQPTKAPHVINNSWSCPEMEGCELSNFGILEEAVNNLKAAGVVVVVSAGNSGPSCSSVNTPSAIFENSFSVGATRSNDTIANFSSRGPVIVDSSGRMKPNISAPGQGVRSAALNGTYSTSSGTSMAGPHVAGVVALMISANPIIAGHVDVIEDIIESTAVQKTSDENCGGVAGTEIPNHTYGHGRINALAAVEAAMDFAITSTETIAEAQPLEIFPNPVFDNFQVQLPNNNSEETRLSIFSPAGKLIRRIKMADSRALLFVGDLATGVYLISVENGEEVHRGRFVKL